MKKLILDELARLSSIDVNYTYLWKMENFQSNQKGPISPIPAGALIDGTIPKVIKASELIPDPQAKAELLNQVLSVRERLSKDMDMCSRNLTDINFGECWAALPSVSVRGLPYLVKGSECDDQIIEEWGSSSTKVLKKFFKADYLITTPGTRFQGSPGWEIAKARIINIPEIVYQYPSNGFYMTIKKELIKVPSMVGWLDPKQREEKILKMWKYGYDNNYIPIPLDFRAFDTKMFPEFRIAITHMLLDVFKPSPALERIKKQYEKLYKNQYLCVPDRESAVNLYKVDNLLGSGIANTQADGSMLNLTLQHYLCMKLGFVPPKELGLTLGDDAVIWVPMEIYQKLGYEGVLREWQKALDPLNMEIHVKKKYPDAVIFFLQKLYVPEAGIIGEYSIVRNIDSIVWAEHYREKIPGVHNHMALEVIGQISTMNNSMDGNGKTTLKNIIHIAVREWLKVDKALTYLARVASKTKEPENALFGYLVRCVGGIDAAIRACGGR